MTSPRERAARRVCRFEPQCIEVCEDCRGVVDAVLDEIREPTPTMRQAGFRAFEAGMSDDNPESDPTVDLVYRAMIDAIKRGEG